MARLWTSYVQSLESSPLATKSLTAGFLNGLGDFTQQIAFENRPYDALRTARQASWGALIPGPLLHFFYGGLARRFPGTSMKNVAIKIAADQTIAAPIIVTSFYWMTGIFQGMPLQEVKTKYLETFWPTMKLNYQIWPLAQAVNFAFVPVAWQVVYVSGVSLVWSVLLSAKNSENQSK